MQQIPLIVDCIQVNDLVETDIGKIEALIHEKGADNIVCIFTTTSCFAPRAPDAVDKVGQLCKRHGTSTYFLQIISGALNLHTNTHTHTHTHKQYL